MDVETEDIVFIQVFTPYHRYHHLAYYAYDRSEYGSLNVGTSVLTSMGVGIIIKEDIPEDKLPNVNIIDIYRLANPKEDKTIKKDWWDVVLHIHKILEAKTK